MNAVFENRAARRRVIAYAALLGASVVLMAVSSNPVVRDLQNGVAFAFKPIQQAVDGVAGTVSSIASTIVEIDQLRRENAALRAQNDELDAEARSAAELRRENEQLTALLQLRSGLKFQTRAATVIARETSEARRAIVIDRGSDDGLAVEHEAAGHVDLDMLGIDAAVAVGRGRLGRRAAGQQRQELSEVARRLMEASDAMRQAAANGNQDGGAAANDWLMQFQADILGVPVIRPQVAETTALGAAYAAGLAVGFWKNVEDLRSNWAKDKEWTPQMDAELRDKQYKGWKKAVTKTFDWVEA